MSNLTDSSYLIHIYTWFMNSNDETPNYDHVFTFENYDESVKFYDKLKESLNYAADHVINFENMSEYSDYDTLQFVIEKKTVGIDGMFDYETFQDGNWKRPTGMALKVLDKKQPIKLILCSKPVNRHFNW